MAKKKREDRGARTRKKAKARTEPEDGSGPERVAEAAQRAEEDKSGARRRDTTRFPIIGMGASAGGLEAFEKFFTNMPPDSGMAFVLVQHLDPTHKSILTDLVKRYTRMDVFQVEDGMAARPNCLHIIPPDRSMAILHGTLQLIEPVEPRGHRMPIDFFFRSLAQDQRERAVCIVLSGTGTEGTLGLKAIKGEGGMVMVQDPESAKYDGMPRSAVATGLADYILPPEEMPQRLIAYVQHAVTQAQGKVAEPMPRGAADLQKIFVLLRAQTGHDFSLYKQNTIVRRIERRMIVHQIAHMTDYVRYLQQNPLEVDTLFKELLIEVTSFFRDTEAFQVLEEKVIPALFENRAPDAAVRIWVPGCSSGEEAYSIAMLVREHMDRLKQEFKVQVFATDINSDGIGTARAGVYPESIAADVPPERLQRFFTKEGSTYRIKKAVRDMLVFAEQDVTKDPPFSKVDLVSCRNLLIYMGPELQRKLLPLFHYALNPGGFLFLGSSETIGGLSDLFGAIDNKWKLFQRKRGATPQGPWPELPTLALSRGIAGAAAEVVERREERRITHRELAERTLLLDYAPACAIINEKCEILYIHGRTGTYLELVPGEASLNILQMARQGLRLALTTAVRKAMAQKESIRCEGIQVKTNGETRSVTLTVRPVVKPPSMQGLLMVVFEDVAPPEAPGTAGSAEPAAGADRRVAELEQELRSTKEYLQTTIQELETSNEELKSMNEELQSSNEELQSTNEELETSKEELHSVNEELVTVNTELETKIAELSKANNDMSNLLASTEIGTIFLDSDLRVQWFTPAASKVVNLIQSDIGRPISHIATNLEYGDLAGDVRQVLDTLVPKEAVVRARDDCQYSMRVLPYRTTENAIEGAVITFVEITDLVQAREAAKDAGEEAAYAESIIATVREPLVVLDPDFRVVSASRSFYNTFHVSAEETEGQLLYDLGDRQWDIAELRKLLEEILPEKTAFDNYEVTDDFPKVGRRTMLLNARRVQATPDEPPLILLAMEDITAREERRERDASGGNGEE